MQKNARRFHVQWEEQAYNTRVREPLEGMSNLNSQWIITKIWFKPGAGQVHKSHFELELNAVLLYYD